MKSEIRIVIADDHPLIRDGLRQAIEQSAGLKIVGEAGDGISALEQIRRLKPDIAVLDIDMPGMDGFAVARMVQQENFSGALIFLTIHRDADFFHEAINLGISGYVLKDSAATDIVVAIRAVAAGENYTSPSLTSVLVRRHRQASAKRSETPSIDLLSPTEKRILELIADYKTSKEIADELGVSYRTIETHRTNICQKLELRGSHALMKFALTYKTDI